ncbi:prepilin-type N-terminal cleavage/methylation domain-containing protein [Eubacterium ruminantium]|nr:prepilin-type N-terminal cleavage/methylation domain-containing protein [Eubacterium ruminantium]
MKKTIKSNKGFSLIEMIIVLAIIAVVSTMSVISIGIINSAKAKDAASVFDSEVASTHAKAKGMAADVDGNGTISDSELEYTYALKLYKVAGKSEYYLATGYAKWQPGGVLVFVNTSTANGGLGRNLSSYVKIRYTGTLETGVQVNDYDPGTTGVIIMFNRRGECILGDGEYEFQKTNGNTVARKYIRANGSHGSKN